MKTTTKTKPKTVTKTLPTRTTRTVPTRKAPEKKTKPVDISYGIHVLELRAEDRAWRIAQLAARIAPPSAGKPSSERLQELLQSVRDAQILLDLCYALKPEEPAPEPEAPPTPPASTAAT